MRALTLVVLVLAALATPAHADGKLPNCLTIKLEKDLKFRLTIDPTQLQFRPEFMGFTISHRTAGTVVETKGDPQLFLGGRFVGMWPYKHLTYVLKSGLRITGHADKEDGNPHAFEIYHADGRVTLIRKANTVKPVVTELKGVQAWLYKKVYQKRTFELYVD